MTEEKKEQQPAPSERPRPKDSGTTVERGGGMGSGSDRIEKKGGS